MMSCVKIARIFCAMGLRKLRCSAYWPSRGSILMTHDRVATAADSWLCNDPLPTPARLRIRTHGNLRKTQCELCGQLCDYIDSNWR